MTDEIWAEKVRCSSNIKPSKLRLLTSLKFDVSMLVSGRDALFG